MWKYFWKNGLMANRLWSETAGNIDNVSKVFYYLSFKMYTFQKKYSSKAINFTSILLGGVNLRESDSFQKWYTFDM